MTSRERFRAMLAGDPVDRLWLCPEGLWARTEVRWRESGMTDQELGQIGFDGVDSVNVADMLPPFPHAVLKDEGEKVIFRNRSGQICRGWKDVRAHDPGYQVLESPVKDLASWQELKWRLDPENPAHLEPDWDERVAGWLRSGRPRRLSAGHSLSIFGYARELMGDEIYYYFYDQPQLMHAVMDFLGQRFCRLIERVSAHLTLDMVFIWEDMAYKGAPLISPSMFREFMLEPTRQVCATAQRCGAAAVFVDSDGDVSQLIPLWLEAGVNVIEPFEVAAGMDVNAVCNRFGDGFWMRGGFDKRALWHGTKEVDVEFKRLQPALESGRYLVGIDHAVSPEASWESFRHYAHKKRCLAHQS